MTKLELTLICTPIYLQCQFLGLLTEPTHPAPTSLSPVMNLVPSSIWDTSKPIEATHLTLSPYTSSILPFFSLQSPNIHSNMRLCKAYNPLISKFLILNMLKPTNFPYNTLIPPVKKLDSSYRLVQDFRIIEAVVPIHSIVPNPYTLHSTIPPSTMDFIVLDLKDQFLTIPLSPRPSRLHME